jgi:pyruvate kinase
MNFSHGTLDDHAKIHSAIRALEAEVDRPIGILQDLQGPKIRIGTIQDGRIDVKDGETIRFVLSHEHGDGMSIPLPHVEIFAAIAPNQELLIDDGRVRTRVTGVGHDYIEATVLNGGTITNRKGVNLPGTMLELSP